ncbi:RT0821/Lpp0805 family surface protein [Cohaesibacter sp. ES.047]|uniref:RT0821/Lpp0805 family surface protein n=1 Tax=Cohaesibacter sp. ES.047 TaxID=1798205 RepID=UPI000BB7D878|nr:RT0821/Lpp0805 family surface protein [Cohaesibacter sp. ES.047]
MSVLAVTCSLGACASIGLGSSELAVDHTTTGSILPDTALLAGIERSDWEILLAKISSFDKADLKSGEATGNWNNPVTGSKGRITQVKLQPSQFSSECRFFKSSMHRVTGVENIQGEICRVPNGEWQITGFASGTTA